MPRPLLLLALSAALAAGCGPKLSPVNGTVTYDGAPFDGATIVFVDETSGKSAFGRSDTSGNFSLTYNDGPGIPAGTYKALVTYKKAVEAVSPTSPEAGKMAKGYLEGMKAKDVKKTATVGGAIPVGKAPGKAEVGELPAAYASPASTPFTIQVPVSGPVELKLEKKK